MRISLLLLVSLLISSSIYGESFQDAVDANRMELSYPENLKKINSINSGEAKSCLTFDYQDFLDTKHQYDDEYLLDQADKFFEDDYQDFKINRVATGVFVGVQGVVVFIASKQILNVIKIGLLATRVIFLKNVKFMSFTPVSAAITIILYILRAKTLGDGTLPAYYFDNIDEFQKLSPETQNKYLDYSQNLDTNRKTIEKLNELVDELDIRVIVKNENSEIEDDKEAIDKLKRLIESEEELE